MGTKLFLVQFIHSTGNGYALLTSKSIATALQVLKNQTAYEDLKMIGAKDLPVNGACLCAENTILYQGAITVTGSDLDLNSGLEPELGKDYITKDDLIDYITKDDLEQKEKNLKEDIEYVRNDLIDAVNIGSLAYDTVDDDNKDVLASNGIQIALERKYDLALYGRIKFPTARVSTINNLWESVSSTKEYNSNGGWGRRDFITIDALEIYQNALKEKLWIPFKEAVQNIEDLQDKVLELEQSAGTPSGSEGSVYPGYNGKLIEDIIQSEGPNGEVILTFFFTDKTSTDFTIPVSPVSEVTNSQINQLFNIR